ncbi:MAG: chloride channel protein [Kofleriaceae bacterium]|nr:chloride channel protein [Kofleriaceae bacterium]MCB9572918.1 chloride channel protein [Kofleriaceae bacterium]
MVGDDPPLELQLVGRLLLQAIAVGLTVGAAGCALLYALEHVEGLLLDRLGGYQRLRAVGEPGEFTTAATSRLWLVGLLPALGALLAGWISRWAPEVRGGGGEQMIEAFHDHGGKIRRRVILLKPLVSIATLGTGGAGGREGPTMHLGGALAVWVAGLMPTTERERRVLMIAGVAAGISAVFRTPLGAALLAIEVLYRDDFESEALIPAVLASVVAYSLSASLLSTAPMFGQLPRFPFHWEHLPLYGLAAVAIALCALGFVGLLHGVQRVVARLPGPAWARPGVGGLALGVLAVAAAVVLPRWLDATRAQVAVLGGGYGSAQLAITGELAGWTAATVLLVVAALRALGCALTVGSGGSAGDFAPSMAIGAVLGAALGHAASATFGVDVSPGAFALVGMATFYGGIAKVPLAATVMVCEMAGSYDLLVPLMASQAVAFVALRRVALYPAQRPDQKHSPAHAHAWTRREVARILAGELVLPGRKTVVMRPGDSGDDVLRAMADAPEQQVFPVVDDAGVLVGLIGGTHTREVAAADDVRWAVAADMMVAPRAVAAATPLAEVARVLLDHDLRAIPVIDEAGRVLGLIDEHAVSRAYLGAAEPLARPSRQVAAVAPPADAGDAGHDAGDGS